MSEGKDRLLAQMKDAEGAVYVLISGFTKEPYVECDKETYDDKVFVYMEEEAAKAKAEALKEEKIPVGAAKILSGHMLLFFTNLYTMGVNALEIHYEDKVDLIQIDEFAKRREDPQLEEGKQWIENPQLHLTALYFAQEVRRPKEVQDEKRMAQLQEEMAADFMKSRFIFALQQDGKGTPLVKLNTGDKYQLVFTDAVEFSRFNRNKAFKPVIVEGTGQRGKGRGAQHYGCEPSACGKPSGSDSAGSGSKSTGSRRPGYCSRSIRSSSAAGSRKEKQRRSIRFAFLLKT